MPGRDLDQHEAVVLEREHRPLGDVADLLAALAGEPAVERDLADRRARTCRGSPSLDDPDARPSISSSRPCAVSVPTKLILRRPGADVREAARPADAALEGVDVDVALGVDLGERQAGDVEPAAVVEVEHVRLVDHRLVVEPGAALVAGDRHAAEDALLDGQHELVGDALLPGDPADQLADPEAEVADRAAAGTRAASGGR